MATRARLLEVAESLVSARGYADVAIKDIAAIVGVKPAAVFYYFPSKSELIVAMLEEASKQMHAYSAALEKAHEHPLDRIRIFNRNFGLRKKASMEFCVAGGLAAGIVSLPEAVQDAVRRYRSTEEEWFRSQLRAAHPHLAPAVIAERAIALVALLQGALLVTRMGSGPDAYEKILDLLEPPLLAA